MSVCVFILIFSAISPALSSVVRQIALNQSCSENQFKCLDGLCIRADQVCDASLDCSDGSDEDLCTSISTNVTTGDGLGRYRRQSACRKLEWQCKDGGCISSDEKCDGTKNCLDGSDETHALCRKMLCLPHLFRCTYGACVDGTAPCDKKTDCADSSDELIPKCRGAFDLNRKEFVCVDGSRTIPPGDLCDGVVNCQDGSDENVSACGEQRCPGNLFQCAYGACVDGNSDCNGIPDCADGSDEADDLCNRATPRPLSIPPAPPSVPTRINTGDYKSGKCELPQYPSHGKYQVINAMDAGPGDRLHYVRLVIQCEEGYGGIQKPEVFCTDGSWSIKRLPDCHRLCILNKHPSVKYSCHVTSNGIQGRRECNESEPTGTKVESICNEPIYHSAYPLPMMECDENGNWKPQLITCPTNCGRRTPAVDVLVAGGQPALRGQLPWHVAIYRKPTKSQNFYRQICGGSLISNSIVLTAAHCFWNDTDRSVQPSLFAVAAAKLYRDWDDPNDKNAQKSHVKDIQVAELFRGGAANYQEDIAVVFLETPVNYGAEVSPVCLSFDINFYRSQMLPGVLGKVAGWGLTGEIAGPSQILKVVDLPFVPAKECLRVTPAIFTESITGDKICAGYLNGKTAVCTGDSGGGLVFPEIEHGSERFYLRGIVSTAPPPEGQKKKCNINTVTTFTNILRHRIFINQYL
nr:modular serine protease-like isoform X1 [Helicoverpa armigera]